MSPNIPYLKDYKETHKVLNECLSHARSKGRTVEGDVKESIFNAAKKLTKLQKTLCKDKEAAKHHAHLNKLGMLAESMYEEVEDNKELESFWEKMAEEIPDLIEWIQTLLETAGETAVQVAETAGEVALEVADVADVVATEL